MVSAALRQRPAWTLLVVFFSVVAAARPAFRRARFPKTCRSPAVPLRSRRRSASRPCPTAAASSRNHPPPLQRPEGRKPSAERYLLAARQAASRDRPMLDTRPGEMVPVPLTVDVVEHGDLPSHGGAARDRHRDHHRPRRGAAVPRPRRRSTMRRWRFFADHPQLLERIHERSAPAFAVFAGSLRVQSGRVVPPGGDAAVALWEALALEKVTRAGTIHPAAVRAERGAPRVSLRRDRRSSIRRAARSRSGLWMPNAALRAERFKALALGVGAFRESHLRTLPLGRASYDLAMTLSRDRGRRRRHAGGAGVARRSGRASSPAPICPTMPARQLRGADEEPIDAAWLVETIGPADVRSARRAAGSARVRASGCSAAPTPAARADVLRRGARADPLPDADVDARAHRHPHAVGVRAGRAPGGAARRARRPPRLRGAGAVSGCARARSRAMAR